MYFAYREGKKGFSLHLLLVFRHLATWDLARIEIRREVLKPGRGGGSGEHHVSVTIFRPPAVERVEGHSQDSLCSALYVQTSCVRF